MLRESRGDQAIGQRLARPVHVLLGQPQAAFPVHGGQVHLAGFYGRQDRMRDLPDLGVDDVHVDREQAAGPDRAFDGIDQFLAGRTDRVVHGLLNHVGTLVVRTLDPLG